MLLIHFNLCENLSVWLVRLIVRVYGIPDRFSPTAFFLVVLTWWERLDLLLDVLILFFRIVLIFVFELPVMKCPAY